MNKAKESVRAAASCAGDTSGNCDAAAHHAERGAFEKAALEMEWAEENARSALHRIVEARQALAAELCAAATQPKA